MRPILRGGKTIHEAQCEWCDEIVKVFTANGVCEYQTRCKHIEDFHWDPTHEGLRITFEQTKGEPHVSH